MLNKKHLCVVWREIPVRKTAVSVVLWKLFIIIFLRCRRHRHLLSISSSDVHLEFELTEVIASEQTSEMKMRIKRDSPCLVLRFMPLGKFSFSHLRRAYIQNTYMKRERKRETFRQFNHLKLASYLYVVFFFSLSNTLTMTKINDNIRSHLVNYNFNITN